MVPLEAWVRPPVDEVHVSCRLDDDLVVRAMSADDEFVLRVPPLTRVPRQCSLLLRFLCFLGRGEGGRLLVPLVEDLDLGW